MIKRQQMIVWGGFFFGLMGGGGFNGMSQKSLKMTTDMECSMGLFVLICILLLFLIWLR